MPLRHGVEGSKHSEMPLRHGAAESAAVPLPSVLRVPSIKAHRSNPTQSLNPAEADQPLGAILSTPYDANRHDTSRGFDPAMTGRDSIS